MTYGYDSLWGLRETRSEAILYDLGYVLKASNELNLPRLDMTPEFTKSLAVGKIQDIEFMAYRNAWDPPITQATLTQNVRPFYDAIRDSSHFLSFGPWPGEPDLFLHLASYYPSEQWLSRTDAAEKDSEKHLRSMMIRASLSVKKGHTGEGEFKPGSEVILPFTAQYWIFGRPSESLNGWAPLCSKA